MSTPRSKTFKGKPIATQSMVVRRLLELWIEQNATAQELADKTGIGLKSLESLPTRNKHTSIIRLERLADAFGYEIKLVKKQDSA